MTREGHWWWWAALAIGVLGRTALLAGKPLWRDEAWVALAAADPLQAVADGRASPLGFLAVTKLVSALPGLPVEVSYRLLPLLAGIALLLLLPRLATALGASRRVALAAMMLAAGAQPLIYYSRELKSYGLDALVAVALPLLGAMAYSSPAATAGARLLFLVAAVAVPWFTFGGIFAAGAVFAWGSLVWWRSGDRSSRVAWVLASAAFLLSFLVVYRLALDHQANDTWMQSYWASQLGRDDRFGLLRRLGSALVDYTRFSFAYLFPLAWPLAMAASLLGALTWPRQGRACLLLLGLVTACVCAVAGITDHYLMNAGRLLLFVLPLPLLWSASALVTVAEATGRVLGGERGVRIGGTVALSLALLFAAGSTADSVRRRIGPARTDGTNFFRFDVRHDLDTILEEGRERRRNGPPAYVSRRLTYMFAFYNRGRWPDVPVCLREDDACDFKAAQWVVRLKGKGWLLLVDEEIGSFTKMLAKVGARWRPLASTGGVRLWEVEKIDRNAPWPEGDGNQDGRGAGGDNGRS